MDFGALEDSRLLARSRMGDERAWSMLVDRYERLVYSVARRTGLSSEAASDVFQSTFVALFRELDHSERIASLPRWLAVVAARESYRVRRVEMKHSGADFETLDDALAAEDRAVDDEVLRSEQARLVREALDTLPPKCQSVLGALFLEDQDYLQTSESLKMPIGSLGATRQRCLQKLRRRLEAIGFFEENVSRGTPVGP